jgi:arylsulfatase A-like enzyme
MHLSPRSLGAPLAALLALASACAPAPPPSTRTLAAETAAVASLEEVGARHLELVVAADAWVMADPAGWSAPAPWAGTDLPVDPVAALSLRLESRSLEPAPEGAREGSLEAGTFLLQDTPAGPLLRVDLEPEAGAPGGTVVRVALAAPPSASRNRVVAGPLAADGFGLMPGERVELDVELGAARALRCSVGAVAPAPGAAAELHVTLEDRALATLRLDAGPRLEPTPLLVPLPPGRGSARLVLEAAGDAPWLAVLAPTVGPLRPDDARDERPDLTVFLADTFRADNLAVLGGPPGLAPHLEEFTAGARVFSRAWAASSWTLPSHASLFLGLHPPQHGADRHGARAAGELVTVVERLRDAGWRTAAVTDSLYVSRDYGMDRGFEWFVEHRGEPDLERTVDSVRAILEAHDGRPLFLFVQSYRTHAPYLPSAEALASHGEALGVDGTYAEVWADVRASILDGSHPGAAEALERFEAEDWYGLLEVLSSSGEGGTVPGDLAARLRALYLATVVDLDRGFGALLDELGPRAEDGWLVFTSDHGEAFGEHGALFHGEGWYDEFLRVPLVVRGPGLAPGVDETPAGLVDLAPTPAQLADLPADPAWVGRSLLAPPPSRAVYGFDGSTRGPHRTVAVVDGELKLVLPGERERLFPPVPERAFDLAADPGEREDLGASEEARDAARALEAELRAITTPAAGVEGVATDAEEAAAFRAMGYAGE